jgi:hypothetical protein
MDGWIKKQIKNGWLKTLSISPYLGLAEKLKNPLIDSNFNDFTNDKCNEFHTII